MTMLGYQNPFRRLSLAIAAWLASPRPTRRRRPSNLAGGPSGPPNPPAIVGHRGAPRAACENTIVSFAKAIELGADAVEADICVTRDGRFVLWHDADPDGKAALVRQAGGEGYPFSPDAPPIGSGFRKDVALLSLSELTTHYGYTSRKTGVRGLVADGGPPEAAIAVLEDLFDWALRENRARHVFLDVKLAPEQTGAALALLSAVRAFAASPRFRAGLLFHFLLPQREILETLLGQARREPLPPALRICADFEFPGALDFARRLSARNVSLGCPRRVWSGFRRELTEVLRAREAGDLDSVVVWTVSEEERLLDLVEMGVDGILTDDVPLLSRILRGRRFHG